MYNTDMSKMFYEEENFKKPVRTGGGSKMSQWLIEKGIAKTESAASIVLIAVALVAIALTFWIVKGDDIKSSSDRNSVQAEQQLRFQERRDARLNQ